MRRSLFTVATLVASTIVLTACSGDLDLEGARDASPMVSAPDNSAALSSVEPTTEPVDISDPEVAPVAAGEWPSQQEGYEFSDEPQGQAEQWIFNHYREQWDAGVRALTTDTWGFLDGDKVPAPLVQYFDGARFAGDAESPLGFLDPQASPTTSPRVLFDHYANGGDWPQSVTSSYYAVNVAGATSSVGAAGGESAREVAASYKIRVRYRGAEDVLDGPYNGDPSLSFDSIEAAVKHMQTHGVLTKSGRALNAGEIGSITAMDTSEPNAGLVVDPDTWDVTARSS